MCFDYIWEEGQLLKLKKLSLAKFWQNLDQTPLSFLLLYSCQKFSQLSKSKNPSPMNLFQKPGGYFVKCLFHFFLPAFCPGCFLFYSCCKISHFRENMKRMRRRMPLSNSFQSWFNFSAANRCRLSINLEWLSNNVRLFYLLVWLEIARPKGAFIQVEA